MFERFTERARQVLVLAQEEAASGQSPFTPRAKNVLERGVSSGHWATTWSLSQRNPARHQPARARNT
jgi:hypothetical protein